MRQHTHCDNPTVFDGLYNLRPFYKPEVHTMALRDGSMWSSTPTDSEDRGASRRADVRREASPLESYFVTLRVRPLRALKIGHYGRVREGTGLGPVPGVVITDYSAMSRYRKVTTCSRVQVS